MSLNRPIKYVDRESGDLKEETVYGENFLFWSYNTTMGRIATDLLFRQKWVSRLYGWWHKQTWTKRKIKPFVERMRVDVSTSIRGIEDFASFDDFFKREINMKWRHFPLHPEVCASPADGRVLAFPVVERNKMFQIKRSSFNLREFLRDETLAEQYDGGSMLVSRLSLADYHHFHFPDSGRPREAYPIEGKFYAGGPYSLNRLVPFYRENHRMLTLFESEHFGEMAIVEVGAFTVGSIRQCYQPGLRVQKGARKGFFELGGSTVVLLFQKNSIRFDQDLVKNTENDLETYVQLGESIGRK